MADHEVDLLSVFGRLHRERDISYFCQDVMNSDVNTEQLYYNQVRQFLITARHDAGDDRPDGFDYVVLALIAKDLLNRSKSDLATVMTGVALAFRSLEPIEMDLSGTTSSSTMNVSIYNMRNKLLHDWFHSRGIWALVNNNISVEKQYDKIHHIRRLLEFRVDDPPQHDIYLLKTKNLTKYVPGHYILLINKYCFHLINIGLFAGDYRREKAHLYQKSISFEKVGTTTLDVRAIDIICQTLASQSHSLFFNNCQNFATNVYEAICEEKGVKVEMPSFSGTKGIIQVLLVSVIGLTVFIATKLAK